MREGRPSNKPSGRTTPRPEPSAPGLCRGCGQDSWADGVTGCQAKSVRGLTPPVHSWPAPTPDWPDPPGDNNPCSCGAMPGGFHHWLCDLELCPFADLHPDDGEQLLYCGCFE